MKTVTTNYFDKSFGPAGSSAGIVILIAGVILSYFNLAFILLMLFGAFIAFTNSSTTIDTKKKRVRFASNIFGIIKIGRWKKLTSSMQIKTLKNNQSFRAYSRGNRQIIVKTHAFKSALFDSKLREIMPLKYFNELLEAKRFAEELNKELKLEGE